MAKGEKTWSSKGESVSKMSFEPLPAGWYDFKLTGPFEVRVAEAKKPGEVKFPRVSLRLVALGTGKDGQKDRMVFHDLYVRVTPNEKGTVLVKMGGQLIELARALGQEVEGAKVREMHGEDIIDPLWLKKWLENRENEVVRGRVKVETGSDNEKRNRIAEFEEGEPQDADEDEDEDEQEDEDEAEEVEEDEDDLKAALKGKKGAAKGKTRR